MGSFADSVQQNVDKILHQVDEKCYSIVWNLFTSVVQLTPSPSHPGEYATGEMSNQWYPLIGNNFSSEFTTATSPNGSASLSRITALKGSKAFYAKDGVMTMTNNSPWAYRAEYLGWPTPHWSGRVQPYMMVRNSIQKTIGSIT